MNNPNVPIGEAMDGLWGGANSTGENVNEKTALGLPAFFRCVDLLSNDVASLPLKLYRKELDGRKNEAVGNPVYKLIHSKPNKWQNSFEFRKLMQVQALVHGNAYALIVWDHATARPLEVLPFHPELVDCMVEDGVLHYAFKTAKGVVVVDQTNVLHIKGLGTDGVKGKPLLNLMAETLGQSIAATKATSGFWSKGLRLDGVVSMEGTLKPQGLKLLRKTWRETYGGSTGERVAILDNGAKFQPIAVTPEQAQFLESKRFSVIDVCRMLGVPPPLAFSMENSTFKNAEEMTRIYAKHGLRPWLVNWEGELNDKLLREDEAGFVFCEFNMEGLLRGDITARSQFYKEMITHGVFAPNEVRAKENMNGYAGGDEYVIMANLVRVADMGKDDAEAQRLLERLLDPGKDESAEEVAERKRLIRELAVGALDAHNGKNGVNGSH